MERRGFFAALLALVPFGSRARAESLRAPNRRRVFRYTGECWLEITPQDIRSGDRIIAIDDPRDAIDERESELTGLMCFVAQSDWEPDPTDPHGRVATVVGTKNLLRLAENMFVPRSDVGKPQKSGEVVTLPKGWECKQEIDS